MKIILVAGARPNFMKIAPLMEAMKACPAVTPMIIHNGQHYDEKMSDLFFRQLGVKLIHVEAGLRNGDRAMSKEINRLLAGAGVRRQLTTSRQSAVPLSVE